jgi:hypothetical protein
MRSGINRSSMSFYVVTDPLLAGIATPLRNPNTGIACCARAATRS